MVEPMNAVDTIGRMILDGPGEWVGSGEQLHELASLIAARVRSDEPADGSVTAERWPANTPVGSPVARFAEIEWRVMGGQPSQTSTAIWDGVHWWSIDTPAQRTGIRWWRIEVSEVLAVRPLRLVAQEAPPTACPGDRHRFSSSYRDGEYCVRCDKRLCMWCAMVGGHRDGCDRATNSTPAVGPGSEIGTEHRAAQPVADPGALSDPGLSEEERAAFLGSGLPRDGLSGGGEVIEAVLASQLEVLFGPGVTGWSADVAKLVGQAAGRVYRIIAAGVPAEPGADRTEPHPITGVSIPIHPDGSTDWPRFAAELRDSATPENGTAQPVGDEAPDPLDALCQISHEAYERAAAAAEWFTNPASRVAWADVPESNKVAMRAAVAAVAVRVRSQARAEAVAEERQRIAQGLAMTRSLGDRPALMQHVDRLIDNHAAGPVPVATPDIPAHPEIVVLCGSTRFKEAFRDAARTEALAGRIVLTVSDLDPRQPDPRAAVQDVNVPIDAETKARFDELHRRRIDLADRVLVLNVGGYIGESTRSEIDYATAHGKPIRYLEEPAERALTATGVNDVD